MPWLKFYLFAHFEIGELLNFKEATMEAPPHAKRRHMHYFEYQISNKQYIIGLHKKIGLLS